MATAVYVLAALFWAVVGLGATWAVFAPCIHDTLLERIGLAGVAMTAFAAAVRVLTAGEAISEGGILLPAALALYVCALIAKHSCKCPPGIPRDKSRPMPLETPR